MVIYSCQCLTSVEEIKCLDNNITLLMDRSVTEEEVSRMQRFVTFYTGEMAGVVWQMVEPLQPKDLWTVAKDIYSYGKPAFIEYKFNVARFSTLFKWQLEDVQNFRHLRTDSNTVWEQFSEIFLEKKNKPKHTIDDTTVPNIVQVHI